MKMPLSDLHELALGKTLRVPRGAIEDARLEDMAGTTSIPVHLGQLHGARAIRVKAQGAEFPDQGAGSGGRGDADPAPVDVSPGLQTAKEQARAQAQERAEQRAAASEPAQSPEALQAKADAELDAMLSGD